MPAKQTAKRIGLFVLIYSLAFLVFSMHAHGQYSNASIPTRTVQSATKVAPRTAPKVERKNDKPEKAAPLTCKNRPLRQLYALFDTSMGEFKVRLYFAYAPKTVENFVALAEGTKAWTDPKSHAQVNRPFYNGLQFYRVRHNFIVQSGDPLNNGTGGPGYTFADEFHPDLKHDQEGVVSMVNPGRNKNGSQFMITLQPEPDYDNRYPVFGVVVQGLDVVKKISNAKVNLLTEHPLKPIFIKKVTIIREC